VPQRTRSGDNRPEAEEAPCLYYVIPAAAAAKTIERDTEQGVCTYRIELNVTDEFGQIAIFLAEDGLVTILEKRAVVLAPLVEADGMAG
jgi:hypothetical protein